LLEETERGGRAGHKRKSMAQEQKHIEEKEFQGNLYVSHAN